jgi:hypothetical protein
LVYGVEKTTPRAARGRKSRSLTAFEMTSEGRGRSFFNAHLPRDTQRAASRKLMERIEESQEVFPSLDLFYLFNRFH